MLVIVSDLKSLKLVLTARQETILEIWSDKVGSSHTTLKFLEK